MPFYLCPQSGVHHALNPDPYRGVFGSNGEMYAKDVQDLIEFGTSGHVAGFIFEAIQVMCRWMPLSILQLSLGTFGSKRSIFLITAGCWRNHRACPGLFASCVQKHQESWRTLYSRRGSSRICPYREPFLGVRSPRCCPWHRHNGKGKWFCPFIPSTREIPWGRISYQKALTALRPSAQDWTLCRLQGIGNGIPLGAVVTTPEIAEVLTRRSYFNTFGGNPLCTAAGLAVLKVIEKEKLQENAHVVGSYLKDRLLTLKDKYERKKLSLAELLWFNLFSQDDSELPSFGIFSIRYGIACSFSLKKFWRNLTSFHVFTDKRFDVDPF